MFLWNVTRFFDQLFCSQFGFFPAVGSRRLSLSNCPWHWLWLLCAQKREVEERERRIITQGTFPQETGVNPSPPLSSLLHLSPLLPLHWLSFFFFHHFIQGGDTFSYCVFFLSLSLSFFLLLFRRDIFSNVEDASCVLSWLLCKSAFCCRGWVFREVEESKRGRALVGFPAAVVPNLTSGRQKGYYYKSEGSDNNF